MVKETKLSSGKTSEITFTYAGPTSDTHVRKDSYLEKRGAGVHPFYLRVVLSPFLGEVVAAARRDTLEGKVP
ncbi:hypothetical protein CEXT_305811 [Caerostris extrusa]|uniref:Uncharacterized protein n=1 Tax=Caerostris extrusa TaxID=172846 RepID=A0AAV4XXZ8_CAEEX|nr:hypothetical protein CEXT_305811 [Caerostris extrusa]